MRSARRSDRGVTIVEAAFALPILMMFIFGLVDIGMWTFNSNQATNAAKDGARAGILDYRLADVPDSPHWDAIVEKVESRLPGRRIEQISISCVNPTGTRLQDLVPARSCSSATVDVDRMRVDVEWNWALVTPIAGIVGVDEGRAAGSATMTIVGSPLAPSSTPSTTVPESTTSTTAASQPCALAASTQVTVSPNPVERSSGNDSKQLETGLTIDFTTNGSTACSGLRIELDSTYKDNANKSETLKVGCGCGDGPSAYSWTYVGSANIWAKGTGEVRVYNGANLLGSRSFTVN